MIQNLEKQFSLNDLGEVRLRVGLKTLRNRKVRRFFLSQKRYIQKVSKSLVCNVLRQHRHLSKIQEDQMASLRWKNSIMLNLQCKSMKRNIACLMYLTTSKRPDTLYDAVKLFYFCNNPQNKHLAALKILIRYVRERNHRKTFTMVLNPYMFWRQRLWFVWRLEI